MTTNKMPLEKRIKIVKHIVDKEMSIVSSGTYA